MVIWSGTWAAMECVGGQCDKAHFNKIFLVEREHRRSNYCRTKRYNKLKKGYILRQCTLFYSLIGWVVLVWPNQTRDNRSYRAADQRTRLIWWIRGVKDVKILRNRGRRIGYKKAVVCFTLLVVFNSFHLIYTGILTPLHLYLYIYISQCPPKRPTVCDPNPTNVLSRDKPI